MMVYQPPVGARDWLPLEVAQKRWIADRLQESFRAWGYQQIVTSTLEWLDTLAAGGAIDLATVIQLQESGGGLLGLRPELTASIARAAATRMADATPPQRLYYHANIFRRHSHDRDRQVEFEQAGVELLGWGGVLADAEIVLLLVECLQGLGLDGWQLILGEAGLTRSLLSPFPEPQRQQVRRCLAKLDWIGLEAIALSPELRDRARWLFDLRGEPEAVLAQVEALELESEAKAIAENLRALVERLKRGTTQPIALILDLSLLQTFDYYTGIVFEAVKQTATETRILGQGGRYDELLGLYGRTAPGIGFALDLEDIRASLLASEQLPQAVAASDWLVVPEAIAAEGAALVCARELRASAPGVRVEIELSRGTPEEIRAAARQRQIARLAWVDVAGKMTPETLTE